MSGTKLYSFLFLGPWLVPREVEAFTDHGAASLPIGAVAIRGDRGFDQEDILTVEILVQWGPLEGGSDPGDLDLEGRDRHTGGLASTGCRFAIAHIQNVLVSTKSEV